MRKKILLCSVKGFRLDSANKQTPLPSFNDETTTPVERVYIITIMRHQLFCKLFVYMHLIKECHMSTCFGGISKKGLFSVHLLTMISYNLYTFSLNKGTF